MREFFGHAAVHLMEIRKRELRGTILETSTIRLGINI